MIAAIMTACGTVAYTLFRIWGERRWFAAGMALAAAFIPMHLILS